MPKIRRLALAAGFGICATTALAGVGVARAAPPVALVEGVDAKVSGVAIMDYLEQSRRLDLGSGGWIEIDYFSSCLHERIVGGVVRVGTERSEVSEGTVERHPVQCDSGKITLANSQAERAAGFVERGGAELKNRIHTMKKNQLIRHGASPLIVRLHPWRDEHRQHCAFGRDHRFWTVRLHGFVRSCDCLQRDRRIWALRLRQSTRSLRNGISPGSPRPCCRWWIQTQSGRSNLQARRSPRLRRAIRSIGLPACGTSSESPAMRAAISTSSANCSKRCMRTPRTSH